MSLIEKIKSSPSSIFTREDILKLLNEDAHSSIIIVDEKFNIDTLNSILPDDSKIDEMGHGYVKVDFESQINMVDTLKEVNKLRYKESKKLIIDSILDDEPTFISSCIDTESIGVYLSLNQYNTIEIDLDIDSIRFKSENLKSYLDEI